jgi:hypothetical protein
MTRVGGATTRRNAGRALAGVFLACLSAAPLSAEQPLSAIEWLQDTLLVPDPHGLYPVTPPTGDAWIDGAITMRPLDRVHPDAVGLFPPARVGLARNFWGTSTAEELAPLIAALPADTLPALRVLAYRLLLAEFDAPRDAPAAAQGSPLLAARIEKLYEFGALDQALALLETLDSRDPGLKLRWLEIALLLGDEAPVCARVLQADPPFPFEPARIYCLARSGDWPAAEDAYDIAEAEGTLPPPYDDLIARFLEVEGHIDGEPLGPVAGLPTRLSPLAWRVLEAIGEPVATHGLPVAFAHADLRGTVGWRAQIEAAERLVRSGALAPNRLLGLYTERAAAASGGIWDRVRAVQRLEAALQQDDPDMIGTALLSAWEQMEAAELEPALVALFAERLRGIPLDGNAGEVARAIGYLSDAYETVALDETGNERRALFLAAVARGLPPAAEEAGDSIEAAVAEAFGEAPELPASALERLAEGQRGAEVLRVLDRIGNGSDPRMLAEGLALLRHLGFEDIARRTALEALLLERRG